MRRVRIALWALVAIAIAGFAFLYVQPARTPAPQPMSDDQHRRTVHPDRVGRQAVLQRQAQRKAVRDLLRLHPLPRRLPDDARPDGEASPAARCRRPSVRDLVRHRRSGTRRPGRGREICRAVQQPDHRPHRLARADRAGEKAVRRSSRRRCRTEAAAIPSTTRRRCFCSTATASSPRRSRPRSRTALPSPS